MKNFVSILALVLFFTACSEEKVSTATCSTAATVRNLSGLDGCGWVFELNDGTKLNPYSIGYCGTPPLPKEVTESPLYNFEYVDSKKVMINYEILDDIATVCMSGKVVKITCISDFPLVGNE